MSTAPVALIQGTGTQAASGHTTASFTPAANTRLVVFGGVYRNGGSVAGDPRVSGSAGLTWTQLATVHSSDAVAPDLVETCWISSDVGGSPTAMTVTIDSAGTIVGALATVLSVLSADTNGLAVQYATAEDLVAGDPIFSFASAPGATNLVIGCSYFANSTATTPPTGYTEISDGVSGITARRMEAFYDTTSANQSSNTAPSAATRSVVVVVELAPASGGGPIARSFAFIIG